MLSSSMKLQGWKNPAAAAAAIKLNKLNIHHGRSSSFVRLQQRQSLRFLSTLSLEKSHSQVEENASSSSSSMLMLLSISSSHFTSSSVGSPSPSSIQWNLTPRRITFLNVVACAFAVSTTWLFCSAIPTLMAFKRAAESLEKLLDVTREELPDTMAAVRLSGMEISDLTMELSDLGQEITQGVRSSTRAVRVAEERLRRLTNMAPSGGSGSQAKI